MEEREKKSLVALKMIWMQVYVHVCQLHNTIRHVLLYYVY